MVHCIPHSTPSTITFLEKELFPFQFLLFVCVKHCLFTHEFSDNNKTMSLFSLLNLWVSVSFRSVIVLFAVFLFHGEYHRGANIFHIEYVWEIINVLFRTISIIAKHFVMMTTSLNIVFLFVSVIYEVLLIEGVSF